MALTIERRMGIRLGAWMTVKTAMAFGLWLAISQVCWAQDPLNDVHVEPVRPLRPLLPWTPRRHPILHLRWRVRRH